MRLGVFVGSFDPVHIGHIQVMDYLIEKDYLDKIIIMPTVGYWDKQNLTDINIRFDMIKQVKRNYLIYDNENNKYPYTYQILNQLKKIYDDELYLIIAADNIVNFDKWQNVDEIIKNKIIVLNRDNIPIEQYVRKFPKIENFIIVQDFPFINISSTELKRNLMKDYLDENVYRYIIEHHLYPQTDRKFLEDDDKNGS